MAQNHFIFIQSETKKPFTVRVSDKNLRSTASGYVIIPRMKSGQHDIIVKMLEANSTEVKFTATIDKKDVGYTLRNLNNNSAALFNMHTYTTISGTQVGALVKNDLKTTETPPTEIHKEIKAEKDIVKNPPQKEVAIIANPVVKLKKGINKISETHTDRNISLLFVDVIGEALDTIDVIIPRQKVESTVPSAHRSFQPIMLFKHTTQIGMDVEFFDLDQEGYNTKCVHLLTKEDFVRLRRRMSAESSEDNMIEEAVKVSKTKCFTTSDIKNLSALFVKEQGKFKFFDALYNNVYDYIEYSELEKELTDTALIKKFRSLVRR